MRSRPTVLYIVGAATVVVGLFGFAVMPWYAALFITIFGVVICALAFKMASPYRGGTGTPDVMAYLTSVDPGGSAYCRQCGGSVGPTDAFCGHCGEHQPRAAEVYTGAEVYTPTNAPPDRIEETVKKWAKKPLVIAGAVILAIIILGLVVGDPEDAENEPTGSSSAGAVQSGAEVASGDAGRYSPVLIAPEVRCSPYDPDDYPYSQSVEAKIVASYGGVVFEPYTGRIFSSTDETDIEHIVARSEAHDSGLCAVSLETRRQFSSDMINLTLASPALNRHEKSDKDAADWLPDENRCWFAGRILDVKQKYRLAMDVNEAEALERILINCDDVEMVLTPGH